MKDSGFLPRSFYTAFAVVWVIGALLVLVSNGFLMYILYRVATHPW